MRLRPHHLLCLLTYKGEGYSPEFVANFDRIAREITAGSVEIVSGPDDVCAPLLNGECHCFNPSVIERDQRAARQLSHLIGQVVAPGNFIELTPARLAQMRQAFASGAIREACEGCQWKPLCDSIAAAGFAGTRILS